MEVQQEKSPQYRATGCHNLTGPSAQGSDPCLGSGNANGVPAGASGSLAPPPGTATGNPSGKPGTTLDAYKCASPEYDSEDHEFTEMACDADPKGQAPRSEEVGCDADPKDQAPSLEDLNRQFDELVGGGDEELASAISEPSRFEDGNYPIPPSNRGRGRGTKRNHASRRNRASEHQKNSVDLESPKQDPKRVKEGGFKEAAENALRVVFVHKDNPEIDLSQEEGDWVREAVVGLIADGTFEESFSPQFERSGIVDGHFLVTCANEATMKWLFEKAKELTKADGTVFVAMPWSEVKKKKKFVAFIRTQKTEEQVIGLLKKQNPALKVERWRLWAFGNVERGQRYVAFGLDKASETRLAAVGHQVYFELGRLTLREQGKPKP